MRHSASMSSEQKLSEIWIKKDEFFKENAFEYVV